MLMLANTMRVYLACEPVDMRKQFNGLFAVATEQLGGNVFSGSLFIFSNRRRNRLKILYWDGSGLWVFAKRLEKGCFSWPKGLQSKKTVRLSGEALQMLLSGIDLKDGCKKAWYER